MITTRTRWRGPNVLLSLFALVAAVSGAGMYLGARTLQRESAERSLSVIPVEALRITQGKIERRDAYAATVAAPTLRVETQAMNPTVATLDFTFLGGARSVSGDARRQLGLELRAVDGCNFVSVMWKLEPENRLEVGLRANPGTPSDCGDRGYEKLVPAKPPSRLPHLYPGERHVLRARIAANKLYIQIDGALAWTGTLPDAALQLKGVTAVRMDYVQAHFRVSTTSSH